MLPFHRSEYFKTAMNTAVGNNNKKKTLEVVEFSYAVLSTVVDFMYGIEIPEEFNDEEDLRSLLRMADHYLMEDLKDAAGFKISKNLNMENVFDISKFADKFRAMLLTEQCAEFLIVNHSSVDDEKLAEMKEGTVMAALAMKMLKEPRRESWVTKLFGNKPDFKWRKDFGSSDAYKGYVITRIQPRMFVRSNQSGGWHIPDYSHMYTVTEGNVGFLYGHLSGKQGWVQVKWLTVHEQASPLANKSSFGEAQFLDLLTSPVSFGI